MLTLAGIDYAMKTEWNVIAKIVLKIYMTHVPGTQILCYHEYVNYY